MAAAHRSWPLIALAFLGNGSLVIASPKTEDAPALKAQFPGVVQPFLENFCYDCHSEDTKKGNVTLDDFTPDAAIAGHHELWLAVLKNVRSGLMPPKKKPQPSAKERKALEDWIKFEAFGIDPKNPDPGRVTVRRLNRVEYRHTIRDLLGISFQSEVEFPPDDTGYGFDNIGDVLSVSPILLEKYLAAAKAIVTEAVPTVSRVMAEKSIEGQQFRRADEAGDGDGRPGRRRETGRSFSYYEAGAGEAAFSIEQAGDYQLVLNLSVRGGFDFDPGRCRIIFKVDDREVLNREFGWHDNKAFALEFDEKWAAGAHRLSFELQPLTPVEKKITGPTMQIVSALIRGPVGKEHWVRPANHARFFSKDTPQTPQEQRSVARDLLRTFASKAFRRPVDEQTVERLGALAEQAWSQPGKTFEAGIAHAMVAVLASPRFLFRIEESEAGTDPKAAVANVDEYALASRLSYFLWSTMPDDELIRLAGAGELRRNLPAQVRRMLADERSENMVRNFTGQWLQGRDVDGIPINARVVAARDRGEERELENRRKRIQELIAIAEENRTAEERAELQEIFKRRRGNQPPLLELDGPLRDAMERETQMFFSHIVRGDRSVNELLESDYTFLNEKLAGLYGIPGVEGPEMRRVVLPPESPRGGVLTHASVLVVTSNPDRTSPVKRGLFVLDNILGTPAPPPPANIPALEASEKDFKDRLPTLREAMELHREQPLCAGCHVRMDPIGLAFESFNAMGVFREKERGQPIDTAGRLITGESFSGVRELKRVLIENHRVEFYRCLTEKLLTFAIGRGLEYYDVETVDQITRRLEADNGRFSALLTGIIESAPFQKQRTEAAAVSIARPSQPAAPKPASP